METGTTSACDISTGLQSTRRLPINIIKVTTQEVEPHVPINLYRAGSWGVFSMTDRPSVVSDVFACCADS